LLTGLKQQFNSRFAPFNHIKFTPTGFQPNFKSKKLKTMNYKNLTAPCGKDCFNCPLYIGEENRENREAFLKRNNIPAVNF
jgi:hypothetical protein